MTNALYATALLIWATGHTGCSQTSASRNDPSLDIESKTPGDTLSQPAPLPLILPLNNSEIINGLPNPIPRNMREEPGKNVPLSSNRTDLLQFARDAFARKDHSQTISVTDVLILLSPGDLEAIELRAQALEADGFPGEAGADFEKCCRSGRTSCCRR